MSIGNRRELYLGEFKGDTTKYYYPVHIRFTVSSIDMTIKSIKIET